MRTSPASPPLRFELATSLAALHELRPEWERLEREVDTATIYQTWAWVVSWYEHFGTGKELQVLAARDEDGRLVGVVPLSTTSLTPVGPRLLHFLGRGKELTEYVDALLRPDLASAVVDAVFERWDRERRHWDLWTLPWAPVESPLVRRLSERARRAGYAMVAEETTRIRVPLPASWEAFQAALGRNMKKHLRKFANRLERDSREPEVLFVREASAVDGALDVLFDLHRRRAAMDLGEGHSDRFRSPRSRAFLRAVVGRLAERGCLWFGQLKIGGQPVATQLCFGLERRFHASYSGYDPAWAWHAVMMFLFRRCVERAIIEGFSELDLGLGHDQEKLRWGGQAHSVVHLTLASPRVRARAMLALWQFRRRRHAATRRHPRPGGDTPTGNGVTGEAAMISSRLAGLIPSIEALVDQGPRTMLAVDDVVRQVAARGF
jgi:CelD/BcsL family acetyltransferase involved in cellulose biosynthesis